MWRGWADHYLQFFFLKKSPNIVFPRDFVETFFFFPAEHPRQVVFVCKPSFQGGPSFLCSRRVFRNISKPTWFSFTDFIFMWKELKTSILYKRQGENTHGANHCQDFLKATFTSLPLPALQAPITLHLELSFDALEGTRS